MGSMPSGKSRCGAHLDARRFRALSLAPVWDEGGSGLLMLEELFHPLSEAVEREWEQKGPVLLFGNALGWSCHLLAFGRLGGGALKSKPPKSRRMSCLEPSNCSQKQRIIISRDGLKVLIRPALL